MKSFITFLRAFLFALFPCLTVCGQGNESQSWLQWRGPTANGMAAQDAKPPLKWSNTHNIRWKQTIAGAGNSTPIVVDGKIFLTSAVKTDRRAEQPTAKHPEAMTEPSSHYVDFSVTCLDLGSGEVIWQKVATSALPHEGHHTTHSYAGASPVSDGSQLYVSFGSQGLFCYDLDGNPVWQKKFGKMRTRRGWGEAASPAVFDGQLVMPWDQEDQSRIIVLDAKTGEIKWQQDRDEPTCWATPLIVPINDRVHIVTNGTNRVRSYDLYSGELIWQTAGTTLNAIPSPVQFGEQVICMAGYRGNRAACIPLVQNESSDDEATAWAVSKDTPYVPSPLLSNHRLYFTKANSAILSCLNAETGDSVFGPVRLPGLRSLYASPIGAAGRVYIASREGTTIVLSDADEFEVLATNRLDDQIDASPIVVGDCLLLRGKSTLYCIGND